jgi:molybdopterin-containing oxidoreductase family membrane subunit
MNEAALDSVSYLDNTGDDPAVRAKLVVGDNDFHSVTEKVCGIVERRETPKAWWIIFAISSSLTLVLFACIGYLITTGIGVWGLQVPVGWGYAIVNFVFWVGIGHAGTLISAILFLLRQRWRTSINRFAEAMTIFAVVCAGIFPGIHVGRIWFAYWLFPIPNQMSMWPNFRSPLLWDVFAVGTYATVSLLFWYMGMIPDLASIRDRAKNKFRFYFYGVLSLGWRSSNRHWHRFEFAYLLLAALATPLVLSVHSVVSFDFAVSIMPGWHTTIFPPYFVAGAIFSGFAMVVTLIVPTRKYFGLEEIITARHLENMAKIMGAADLLDQETAQQHTRSVGCLDPDQCRHVVRTLRHRCQLLEPRLPADELGLLPADRNRRTHIPRELRPLHDALPALRTVPADGRHGRGQRCDAAGPPRPSRASGAR